MKKIIHDVQNFDDVRSLTINKVGTSNSAYKGTIRFGRSKLMIQGVINCLAHLEQGKKGTHMSRMIRGINNYMDQEISITLLNKWSQDIKEMLGTKNIFLEIYANGIRKKKAPITKINGYESFKINFFSQIFDDKFSAYGEIMIVGTSLCPASKKNSKYGAHSQRSEVRIKFPLKESLNIKEYFDIIEDNLSAQVYPVLKLEDESYITEKAYENPKFVEDIVRDICAGCKNNKLEYIEIECRNLESIHTHDAYALITNNPY